MTSFEQISDSEVQAKWLSALKTATPGSANWLHFRTYDDWLSGRFDELLAQRVGKSSDLRNTCLVLCPKSRGGDEPGVPELGPLGNALFYLDPNHKLKGTALQWSRFRNTTWRRQAAYLGKTLFLSAALGLTGVVSAIVTDFHGNHGIYVVLALLAIVAVPLGNMLTSDGLAPPVPAAPDKTQLADLRAPIKMAQILERIAAGSSRLLIVIDDITSLARVERRFLDQLIDKRPMEEIAALRAKAGLLVVTLDPTRTAEVPKARCYELAEPSNSFIEMTTRLAAEKDSLLEARARALIGTLAGDKQGRWGALDLLAICTTDAMQTRTREDWREVLRTDNSTLSLHIQEMGLSVETDPMNLLRQLADTDLYSSLERSYRRDRDLTRSLNKILHREHRSVMLAANLFWWHYYSAAGRSDSFEERAHPFALEAARSVESASGIDVVELIGALVRAARFWRKGGETELSADALGLCRGLIGSEEREVPLALLEEFSTEWLALYLLSGLPSEAVAAEGEGPGSAPEALQRSRVWKIQLTQARALKSGGSVEAVDDSGLSAEVQNAVRCMAAEADIRELGDGWPSKDAKFAVGRPEEGPNADLNEFLLREVRAEKAKLEDDLEAFVSEMKEFRRRLNELVPHGAELGLRAVWLFGRAMYDYRLLGFWDSRRKVPHSSSGQDSTDPSAAEIVAPLLLDPVHQIETDLPVQTRRLLENALELSNLILFRGLSIFVVEAISRLLSQYTAVFSEPDPLWWETWDRLIEATLEECSRLGWNTSEVVIRYHRASFFQSLDVRSSAWDKLLFYKAAVRAHYPVASLLGWSDELTSSLTGPDLNQKMNLELAHVYEERAGLLERSTEARALARDLEEIKSLVFAAQSYIFGNEVASARKALMNALPRVVAKFGELNSSVPDGTTERGLLFNFHYVCGLLPETAESALPRLSARQLWQLLREDDALLPFALLLIVEAETKGDDWCREAELSMSDCWNPHLSLKQAEGSAPHASPKTQYEFWVRLLTGWLTGDSWAEPASVAVERARWSKFLKVQDAVIALARAGLPLDGIPEIDKLVAALLEETYRQVSQVLPDDNLERSVLELLMNNYQRWRREWHDRYLEVCQELEGLLERESQQVAEGQRARFIDLIVRIDTYLSPLQDIKLLRKYLETDSEGQVPEIRAMEAELRAAEAALQRGDPMGCWRTLQPFLEVAGKPPVTLLKLRVLDTARRAAMEPEVLKSELPLVGGTMESALAEYASALTTTILKQEDKEVAARISNHVMHIFSRELV